MDCLHSPCAEIFRICEGAPLEGVSFTENTSCKQPSGHVVLASHLCELRLRHSGYDFLRPLEVMGPGGFPAPGVGDHKVSKAKFPADIFRQLVGEGLGALHYKAGLDALCNGAHAFLGTLHQDGHLGDFPSDEVAKVYAGVQFLVRRLVVLVDDKADIRDYAKETLLVGVVELDGVVVVCCHQDLGARTLSENLLVLVEGVPDGI